MVFGIGKEKTPEQQPQQPETGQQFFKLNEIVTACRVCGKELAPGENPATHFLDDMVRENFVLVAKKNHDVKQ